MTRPTLQTYQEWQEAFDHFNRDLFGGQLSPCLITLSRKERSKGYFSEHRFVTVDGQRCHELAMNPMYFPHRSPEAVLSTFAHEMVHHWQADYGQPGRRRYHNRQWALKMHEIGLHPTSTGEPGGRQTGERVTHYIVEGGPFIQSCRALLQSGHHITWLDRFTKHLQDVSAPPTEEAREDTTAPPVVTSLGAAPLALNAQAFTALEPASPRSTRQRYTCPGCAAHVWGKQGLGLHCRPCNQAFLADAPGTKT